MRAVLLASILAAAACGGADAPSTLPDVRLSTLGGPLGPSLGACATDKCLTVVVAPWCGVCHQVTPDIVRLRRFLDKAGVGSRVVVGLAELGELKGMAALFGSDTLLDPEGVVAARGVPLFLVTDRSGAILKRVNGFPRGASSADELAAFFGLP